MALVFESTLAHPTNTTHHDGFWARFYDDDSCTTNGGISVSLTNPGCLNEAGRGSMKIHGHGFNLFYLISSPTNDCPCQSHCMLLHGRQTFECIKLRDRTRGSSYRFVAREIASSRCPSNQCWSWTTLEMDIVTSVQASGCSRASGAVVNYGGRWYQCFWEVRILLSLETVAIGIFKKAQY